MNNLLINLLTATEQKMNETYITDRALPAMESLSIVQGLYMDYGQIPITLEGDHYIVNTLVESNESEIKIPMVDGNYSPIRIFTNKSIIDLILSQYSCSLAVLNNAIRFVAQSSPVVLANIFVKRYVIGNEYSTLDNTNSFIASTSLSYSLLLSLPLNISFEMAEYIAAHPSTSFPSLGKRLSFKNGTIE
jgi:hypothetical protein